MAIGKEVADAYIEVHGDLSKFRKDLNKANGSMRAAGAEAGENFSEGFGKRAKDRMTDQWSSIITAMESGKKVDWDKAIGKFDSTSFDEAAKKMKALSREMEAAGKLDIGENAEEGALSYKKLAKAIDASVDSRRKDTEAIAAQKAEQERYNKSLGGMLEAAKFERMEDGFKKLTRAMESTNWKEYSRGFRTLKEMREETDRLADSMREMGRISDEQFSLIQQSTRDASRHAKAFRIELDEGGKKMKLLPKLMGKVKLSWARMDGTVKLVLGLIATAGAEFATLLSGAAASATSLVSSMGMALTTIVPLGAAGIAFGTAIALAVGSMERMKATIPGLTESFDAIGAAWEVQTIAFGAAWGPALRDFSNSLANVLGESRIGAGLGAAFAGITGAFEDVVNGPGFKTFLHQMGPGGPLANAVEDLGIGLAGVFDWLFNMMAASAPVAEKLAETFKDWGQALSDGSRSFESWDKMTEVFEKGRESLMAIIDLVGSIGSALGTMFMLGADSGNRMLTALAGIVDKFNAWMQTEDGREKMLDWFRNGERIMAAMEPVLVGLADALGGLVDEKSIQQFEHLMRAVGDFLPLLGDLLRALSGLGLLNILFEALGAIGEIISPLLPNIQRFGEAVNEFLIGSIRAVTPMLKALVEVFTPLGSVIVDVAEVVGPKLVEVFQAISDAMTPVLESIGDFTEALWGALGPALIATLEFALEFMVDKITAMLDIIGGIIEFLTGVFTGDWDRAWAGLQDAFDGFVSLFVDTFNQFWELLKEPLTAFGEWVAEVWNGMWAGLTQLWTDFSTGLSEGWNGFWAGLTQMWTDFTTGFMEGWNGFWGGLGEIVTGFVTVITDIWNNLLTAIAEVNGRIFEAVSTAWQAIVDFFTPIGEAIWTVVSFIWETLVTIVSSILLSIFEVVRGVWLGIVGFINGIMEVLREEFGAEWNAISTAISNVLTTIATAISTAWNGIVIFLGGVLTNIRTAVTTAWNAIKTAVTTAVNGIKTVMTTVWNAIKTFVTTNVNAIKTTVTNVWNAIKSFLSTTINSIKSTMTSVWGAIKSYISTVVSGIKSNISSVWGSIKSYISTTVNGIKSTVTTQFNNMKSAISTAMGNIKSSLSSAWTTAKTTVSNAITSIKTSVKTGFDNVMATVRGLPGSIRGALSGLGNLLHGAGASIMRGFLSGLKAAWGAVTDFVGGIASWIANNKGPISYDRVLLVPAGKAIMQGLGKGLESMLPGLKSILQGVSGTIQDSMLGAMEVSKMRVAGRDAAKGFAEGIKSNRGLVGSALGDLSTGAIPGLDISGTRVAPQPVDQNLRTSGGIIIEAGAIPITTPAEDPGSVAGMVIDEFARFTKL